MLESSFGEFARDTPSLYATPDRRTRPVHGGEAARAWRRRATRPRGGRRRPPQRAWRATWPTNRPPAMLHRELATRAEEAAHPVDHPRADHADRRSLPHGGRELGRDLLLQWVLWTGGGRAGALLARGHVLSILAAAISAGVPPRPAPACSARWSKAPRKARLPGFHLRDDAQTSGLVATAPAGWCWCSCSATSAARAGVDSGAAIARKLIG